MYDEQLSSTQPITLHSTFSGTVQSYLDFWVGERNSTTDNHGKFLIIFISVYWENIREGALKMGQHIWVRTRNSKTNPLGRTNYLFMYCEHNSGFDYLRQVFGIFFKQILVGPADGVFQVLLKTIRHIGAVAGDQVP